jgi:hypothetical protein
MFVQLLLSKRVVMQGEHLAGRHVGRSLPVLAMWECCVSLCENSGKRLRFSNQLKYRRITTLGI